MVSDTAVRSQHLQSRLSGLSFLTESRPHTALATEIPSLNDLLPGGGIALGSFVEILSSLEGCGAYSLAFILARKALPRREAWAVVDSAGTFYPPAAAALGYDLKRLVLLRPRAEDDAWAFTQLLRSADISVCFWATSRMDNMVFRRLQLAAERGAGLGFVIRPAAVERKPCWAGLRLSVARRSACLSARVLYASGRFVDSMQEVEVAP